MGEGQHWIDMYGKQKNLLRVFSNSRDCLKEELRFNVAYKLFLGAAFGITFSIALGETLLGVAFIVFVFICVKARRRPVFTLESVFALLFLAWAVFSVFLGVDKAEGLSRLSRLFWFAVIPLSATVLCDMKSIRSFLVSVVAGCSVLSFYMMACNFAEALGVSAHGDMSFSRALINSGSMTDGQMLVVGILAVVGLILSRKAGKNRRWLYIALSIQVFALIVNFKRGSWVSLILAGLLFLLIEKRWKAVAVSLALIFMICLAPQVQVRIKDLKNELDAWGGGRLTMWTKITPQLIKEHPVTGVGYGSMSNDLMLDAAEKRWREERPGVRPAHRLVEIDRNHLHSNFYQVLAATGWVGLAIYVFWMGMLILRSIVVWLRYRKEGAPGDSTLICAISLMILSLLFNGLVEYNFGDTELLILLGALMGPVGALFRGRIREVAEETSFIG